LAVKPPLSTNLKDFVSRPLSGWDTVSNQNWRGAARPRLPMIQKNRSAFKSDVLKTRIRTSFEMAEKRFFSLRKTPEAF
jgi:hypothetical protein